jgi:hypothetical protein
MGTVLIRDLPEDAHRELARRARERGQSLQQYLAAELRGWPRRRHWTTSCGGSTIGAAVVSG